MWSSPIFSVYVDICTCHLKKIKSGALLHFVLAADGSLPVGEHRLPTPFLFFSAVAHLIPLSSQSPVVHLGFLCVCEIAIQPPLCSPFLPLCPLLPPCQPHSPAPHRHRGSCLRAFALLFLPQDRPSPGLRGSPLTSALLSAVMFLPRPSLATFSHVHLAWAPPTLVPSSFAHGTCHPWACIFLLPTARVQPLEGRTLPALHYSCL